MTRVLIKIAIVMVLAVALFAWCVISFAPPTEHTGAPLEW